MKYFRLISNWLLFLLMPVWGGTYAFIWYLFFKDEDEKQVHIPFWFLMGLPIVGGVCCALSIIEDILKGGGEGYEILITGSQWIFSP